jgi:hypothetical protein
LIDRVPSFYNENRVFPYFLKVPMESLAWRLSGNSPKPSTTRHSSIAKLVAQIQAAGYACTRAEASLGVWDVIGIGSVDVVLLQVNTRDWLSSTEMDQL